MGASAHCPDLISVTATHLKRAPKRKREGTLQVSLFGTPAFTQLVVADKHLLARLDEAGVDVKGDVVASQEVHCEPAGDQTDSD